MNDDLRPQLQATLGTAYSLERELGGGGMSRVFLAQETALGRTVVVKVLTPALAAGVSADRFAREVKLAARLQHPSIVPLLTAGVASGLPYYTMPYVRGESLRARLASGGMSLTDASSVLRDVARALAYAHGEGVVHRDIKPENVLISGGVGMVADFGIAKAVSDARTMEGPGTGDTMLTQDGISLGTPSYMSPEQATGDPNVDHRADLYAWGVMAWELLAGTHPFAGRTGIPAMIAAHIAEPAPSLAERRPEVPKPLADVVMRCLAKDPAQRPASADELLAATEGVTSGPHVLTSSSPHVLTPSRLRRPALVLAVVTTLGLAFGAWKIFLRSPAAGSAAPRSLAVLPFETVGGDTANAYFAEGIADELTTALSHVPELRLAGKRSAARFSGRTSTVQEIGQSLNVGAVLEGSVRRADNRIRVSAELTGATDGLVLWSETYERDAKDVFKVQDDIANAIVAALRVRLTGGAAPGSTAARGTSNLEAYDLYLRGLYLYRRRGPGLVQAREFFEQAIARDSKFARAYAALAATLLTTPYFLPVHMGEMLPPARAAAERALALDPNLAESHVAMGYVYAESFEWPQAEAEYRTAIAMDPASAEPLYRLGNMLLVTGRTDEAVPVLEAVRTRDPLYAVAASYLAWAYAGAGRYDDAIAEGRRALELEPKGLPQLGILASIYNAAGQPDSAVALARRLLSLTDSPYRIGAAARTLAIGGQVAEARALTQKVAAVPLGTWGRESALAYAWMGLGDTTRALAAMERAASGDGDLLYSSFSQLFFAGQMEPLRGNTRLLAVMKRYNLDPGRFFPAQPK